MKIGGINTTEICNLSCAMCHFHGPRAPKVSRFPDTLEEKYVMKFIDGIPKAGRLTFSAHGEFFLDTNCLKYLNSARRMGFSPGVITNGQLLTSDIIDALVEMDINGTLTISVDTINAKEYNSIRRGGDFRKILNILDYINNKYGEDRPFATRISSILFGHNTTFVNLSDESLAMARKRAEVFGLQGRIRFYQANAERLSETVPVEQYDLVSFFGGHTLYAPPREYHPRDPQVHGSAERVQDDDLQPIFLEGALDSAQVRQGSVLET